MEMMWMTLECKFQPQQFYNSARSKRRDLSTANELAAAAAGGEKERNGVLSKEQRSYLERQLWPSSGSADTAQVG